MSFHIGYGDVVKVDGYDNGRQGTVIRQNDDSSYLIQMGSKTINATQEMITLARRCMENQDGSERDLSLQVGDSVTYTFPNPSTNADGSLTRYGTVVSIVSKSRVMVQWLGEDEPSDERINRVKWVPMIPAWFKKNINSCIIKSNVSDWIPAISKRDMNSDNDPNSQVNW
jgi:hypothetical protein